MNKILKLCLKIVGCILLVLLVILICYVIYFVSGYGRIEDNTPLDVSRQQTNRAQMNTDYTITTYNIGFGAYSDDYSFFLDGGTQAVAFSKDAVLANTKGSIATIWGKSPDFALFQEVDLDSTRSYHVNQYEMLEDAFPDMSSTFAINFDSPFIFYPITQPHGKSLAGIATFAKFEAADAVRRSLPIDNNINKYIDLDRCFSYTEYPITEEKSLYLYNVHLSAYSYDPATVENQVKMLAEDMDAKLKAGNYVIAGGDFNQDVLGNSSEVFHTDASDYTWARAFDKSLLPADFTFVQPENTESLAPTSRVADAPYSKGESFVIAIDGFIISNNITPIVLEHMDTGFRYSDHNPVLLQFRLQ